MLLDFIPIVPDIETKAFGGPAKLLDDVLRGQISLYERTNATMPWIGYFAVDPSTNQIFGACSFVGPPADSAVEIAYFTFPGSEGRGIAGHMAAHLIGIARSTGRVDAIVAHTLPE